MDRIVARKLACVSLTPFAPLQRRRKIYAVEAPLFPESAPAMLRGPGQHAASASGVVNASTSLQHRQFSLSTREATITPPPHIRIAQTRVRQRDQC